MWPFPNPADLFGSAVDAVSGWAWDKVVQGVYTWFANGLLLLLEWVWRVLDVATSPRLTDAWFATGLMQPLAAISLSVIVALMLGSAVQAGFGGRPELVVDALKEGPKAIVASAVTVTVMDILIRTGDALAGAVWLAGRADAQKVVDGLVSTLSKAGPLATSFLGPLALLFGMVGLLVTTVVLFMRSTLLYLVAAFAPIVWASSVSPIMRGSGRRLVHVTVALVLAKPAITVTLIVGVKLLANAGAPGADGSSSGAAALGTLVSGFAAFGIAGLSPWVIYRLIPTMEGATASSGIVGGWGRSGMSAVQAGLMVKSFGATAAMSAASKALPQQSGLGQAGSGSGGSAAGGGGSGSTGSQRSAATVSATVGSAAWTSAPGSSTGMGGNGSSAGSSGRGSSAGSGGTGSSAGSGSSGSSSGSGGGGSAAGSTGSEAAGASGQGRSGRSGGSADSKRGASASGSVSGAHSDGRLPSEEPNSANPSGPRPKPSGPTTGGTAQSGDDPGVVS